MMDETIAEFDDLDTGINRSQSAGSSRMVLGLKRRAADVSPLVSATVKQGRRAHAHRSPESKPSALGLEPSAV
jgi:hypothetical protein